MTGAAFLTGFMGIGSFKTGGTYKSPIFNLGTFCPMGHMTLSGIVTLPISAIISLSGC